jgi:hypothetical protein
MTKQGRTTMLKKKNENEKYAEASRQREMDDWRNR